ncbi:MAG: hypothetical protein HY075_03075 [Deltaproteobacteria bacterium]|nr:hypothetical protein [Deltaproteobacteria bacterium]
MSFKEDALSYHSRGRKGKIEVVPTKPVATQHDLSLAYTPGVAEPCRAIAADDEAVYEYTAKGNLVAVVSNGTAVLGLGNIGPHASKPVMEGKGILFKQLADIDVFDIELNAPRAEDVIQAVRALEPTFGGINLEDIKAPDCGSTSATELDVIAKWLTKVAGPETKLDPVRVWPSTPTGARCARRSTAPTRSSAFRSAARSRPR